MISLTSSTVNRLLIAVNPSSISPWDSEDETAPFRPHHGHVAIDIAASPWLSC